MAAGTHKNIAEVIQRIDIGPAMATGGPPTSGLHGPVVRALNAGAMVARY
jgi:hypothetical protein